MVSIGKLSFEATTVLSLCTAKCLCSDEDFSRRVYWVVAVSPRLNEWSGLDIAHQGTYGYHYSILCCVYKDDRSPRH